MCLRPRSQSPVSRSKQQRKRKSLLKMYHNLYSRKKKYISRLRSRLMRFLLEEITSIPLMTSPSPRAISISQSFLKEEKPVLSLRPPIPWLRCSSPRPTNLSFPAWRHCSRCLKKIQAMINYLMSPFPGYSKKQCLLTWKRVCSAWWPGWKMDVPGENNRREM